MKISSLAWYWFIKTVQTDFRKILKFFLVKNNGSKRTESNCLKKVILESEIREEQAEDKYRL